MRHRFAFLPLISDPDGRDKSRLFHDLETETEVELAADAPHPPVFACVMRKQGSHSAHKQLECHGFVCNTSEDAIIIAANLYQVNSHFLFNSRQIWLHDFLLFFIRYHQIDILLQFVFLHFFNRSWSL